MTSLDGLRQVYYQHLPNYSSIHIIWNNNINHLGGLLQDEAVLSFSIHSVIFLKH